MNSNTPPTAKQSRYTAHPLDDNRAIIRDGEKHLATVPDMATAMSLADKLNNRETLILVCADALVTDHECPDCGELHCEVVAVHELEKQGFDACGHQDCPICTAHNKIRTHLPKRGVRP